MVTLGSLGMMRFDVASSEPLWTEPRRRAVLQRRGVYAERLGALLCGENSGQVVAYDIATGAELGQRFDSQLGGVCSLAVSARRHEVRRTVVVPWQRHDRRMATRRRGTGQSVGGGHSRRALRRAIRSPVETLLRRVRRRGRRCSRHSRDRCIDGSGRRSTAGHPSTCSRRTTHERAVAYFPEDGPLVGTTWSSAVGWDRASRSTRTSSSWRWVTTVVVVVSGADDDGMVLQGVDPDTGQVGSPTIDGTGEFMIWHVAFGPDALYTASSALRSDPVYQVQRRDPGRRRRARVRQRLFERRPPPAASSSPARPTVASSSSTPRRWSRSACRSPESTGPPTRSPSTTSDDDCWCSATTTRCGSSTSPPAPSSVTRSTSPTTLPTMPTLDADDAGAVLRSDGMQAAVDTGQGIVVWDLDPDALGRRCLSARRPQPDPCRMGSAHRRSGARTDEPAPSSPQPD